MIYLTTLTDKTQLSCPALGFNKAPPLFLLALFCSVKDSEVTWTPGSEVQKEPLEMGSHQVWKSSRQGEHFQLIAARKEKIHVINDYGKTKMGRVVSLYHLYYLYRREYLKHPYEKTWI